MSEEIADRIGRIDRRGFLGTGAATLAAAAVLGDGQPADAQATHKKNKTPKAVEMPRRSLGRTGVDVTILSLGTWMSPGGERLLRTAWANGIRYVDTAKSYGSEPMIAPLAPECTVPRKRAVPGHQGPAGYAPAAHRAARPAARGAADRLRRPDLPPRRGRPQLRPRDAMAHEPGVQAGCRRDPQVGQGQVRRLLDSSSRSEHLLLQAAAQGGFVDAIMLQNNPWIAQDDDMNRALDACYKQGIGLISMKQVAGNMNLDDDRPWRSPNLTEKGLTPYQALLHAIWTDERFSSVCVSMRNTDQIRENAAAARLFQPLKKAEIDRLRDACIAAGPTMCASCDGRCSRAAGTTAELGNLTRFLTYHEHHGYRAEARRLYAELADAARDWHGADLEAARQACTNQLDFAKLLPKADELLG